MKMLRNEKGIALVMVLVLSLISLAVVSSLLFMVTQGTRLSGSVKLYRTAEEASQGGIEQIANLIDDRGTPTTGTPTTNTACLDEKLAESTADWASCTAPEMSLDPSTGPDLTLTFGATPFQFTVSAKIVDTVQGNSETGGLVARGELGGKGVVASTTGLISPPHTPYLHRVEVQSENTANARERARYSVLYAY